MTEACQYSRVAVRTKLPCGKMNDMNKIVEVEQTPRGLHVYRTGYKITGELELEDDDAVILEMNDGVCFGVWILDYWNWSVSDWADCSARDVVILDTKVDAEVERWIREHP